MHVFVLTVALGATTVLLVVIIVWLVVLHAYTRALDLGLATLRVAYSASAQSLPCSEDAGTQTDAAVSVAPAIASELPSEDANAHQCRSVKPSEQPVHVSGDTKVPQSALIAEDGVVASAWETEQTQLRDDTVRQINKQIQPQERPKPVQQLTARGFDAADLEEARAFAQSVKKTEKPARSKGSKAPLPTTGALQPKQSARAPPQGRKAWIAPPKPPPTDFSALRAKATVRKAAGRFKFTEPAPSILDVSTQVAESQSKDVRAVTVEQPPTEPELAQQESPPANGKKSGIITIEALKDVSPKKQGPGLQCKICLRWSTSGMKLHSDDAINVCSACHSVVDRIQDAKRVIDEPDFYMPGSSRFPGDSLLPSRQHAASGASPSKTESTYTSTGDIIIAHIPETPPGDTGVNGVERTPVKAKSSTGNTRADATGSPLARKAQTSPLAAQAEMPAFKTQAQLVDLDDEVRHTATIPRMKDLKPRGDNSPDLLASEHHCTTPQVAVQPAQEQSQQTSTLSATSAPFAPSRSSSKSSDVSALNSPTPLVEYKSRVSNLPDPFVPQSGNTLAPGPQAPLTATGPRDSMLYTQHSPHEHWQTSSAPAPEDVGYDTIVYDFAAPVSLHASPSTSIAEAYYRNTPFHMRTNLPQHWLDERKGDGDGEQLSRSRLWRAPDYENTAPPQGLPISEHLQPAFRSAMPSKAVPIVNPSQANNTIAPILGPTHRSTSLSKAIPIIKPSQAFGSEQYDYGKQSTVKSSCDVSAARTSDPGSERASGEQQQQQQKKKKQQAHSDGTITETVPRDGSGPQDNEPGERGTNLQNGLGDYNITGTHVKPNNTAKTLRMQRKAARDALNDEWHVRDALRLQLNSGWTLSAAEALEDATKSYNTKRQQLASLMVSGQLNEEDAELYPEFSIKDTSKPKVSVTSYTLLAISLTR